jgi:hypothetical protein
MGSRLWRLSHPGTASFAQKRWLLPAEVNLDRLVERLRLTGRQEVCYRRAGAIFAGKGAPSLSKTPTFNIILPAFALKG